ncbi:endonuclease/exonuclease/phosphatase family protein [Treponema sp.]
MVRVCCVSLFILSIPFTLIACVGCDVLGILQGEPIQSDTRRLILASWNLQAFFDGEDAGNEYQDYREDKGWTAEKAHRREKNLAEALSLISENGPDLLAIQEIESSAYLKMLAEGPLARCKYGYTAFSSEKGASLGLGFLSRVPITEIRAHSASDSSQSVPRPILEVHLNPGGSPLVVFICHWKSKLGGDGETEGQRQSAARILLRRLRELEASGGVDALIMGDLNENVDEFYRRGGEAATALIPDEAKAALSMKRASYRVENSSLVLSKEKPPLSRSFPGAYPLYSPWYASSWSGTYVYKGDWESIDHALIPASLFDGRGWEYLSFRVVDSSPFVGEDGFPRTFSPRTGMGLSDHLPIVVELQRVTAATSH